MHANSDPSFEKTVVVGLSGGLGNQLFQFAAGRALSLKLGASLVLDAAWFCGRSDRIYALEPFCIEAQIHRSIGFLPNWVNRLESRLARRWANKRFGIPIYREPHFQFDNDFSIINQSVYLEGFWQSERYFLGFSEIIRNELTLKVELPTAFDSVSKNIECTDSICLHVRRGDYVTNPIANLTHGLCSTEYIYEGIKTISTGLNNPHCFIFSDDPLWAKQNLKINLPSTIVDIAKPQEAHFDLVMMARCKYFVIANSSLSWWGAWLSSFPLKRVVAPKIWFANSEKNTIDLIPSSWVRL